MNRIQNKFREIRSRGKKALSVFLTAGFPHLADTCKLVAGLEKSGVDFFEIGFPFSDPIADGPTIQKSSEIALRNGMTWKKLLLMTARIRKTSQVPLILMTYANALFCRGWEKSAREMKEAGFDAVIIPDMIPEESEAAHSALSKNGIDLVYLLAPTSSAERVDMVCKKSSGFIYCVSVTGVTGARKSLSNSAILSFLKQVKKKSPIPVLLGFGISKPEHLLEFRQVVDGFIIGSALIKAVESGSGSRSLIERAKKFIMPFDKAR